MKHILGYKEHENKDKVQWIKVKPVKSKVESDKLKELIELATSELFEVFYLEENPFHKKMTKKRPILKYGVNEVKLHTLLAFNNLIEGDYYNNSAESLKSADKKSWHEMLGNKDYLPLTVTDKREIKKLEFPIIAKPAEGHSGIGIMKFDTLEECEAEVNKQECVLDTYSEMVKDIDTEYRFLFVKDKVFLMHERVAIKKDNKTITTKKANEELSFLYVEQDLDKFTDSKQLDDILIDFRKYVDLDFFALDILVDKNGKYWLIESNSNAGMGGNTLARAYEGIYKDFFDTDIPQNKQKIIDYICEEYYKEINRMYPEEMKKSKNPKIYE